MSEIFAAAGVDQPVPGLRQPAAVTALRPSHGGSPAATLLAAAAAGLVGLAAGAFVIRMPAAPAQAAAKVAIQAQPGPQARPQFQPARAAPPIVVAEAAPAPTTQEAAPIHAAAKSPPVRARTAARRRAQFRVKLARLGAAKPAEARPVVRLPVPVAQPASCEQDAQGDDCRRAVVEADRHLRAVYESAIRRGVSRSTLVDYRDRWSDLREQQTEDPTRLIESYGALAYDLGREDPDDQDDAPRPRGRSGLKALADLLLPWR